ncbi:hypothetical protein [Pseudonocardia sp.]|uniref:Cap15 family cyclic dinucleotide receptor domain-containing protein n=1 Tax=Pseudonocardia sp. TaxID=60912 RepID=UPI003D141233
MNRPAAAVRATAAGIGISYGAVLYFAGVRLDGDIKRILAYLPSLAVLILVIWDTFLWRLPLLWRSTARPRIDGLWSVVLHPTAESHIPEGGDRGPIEAFAAISQTYWSVSVRLLTRESMSLTRSHFWDRTNGSDTEWLTFVYDNSPMQRHRARSARHLGTCSLRPGNRRPSTMAGTYFTDRYTQGDMTFQLVGRDTGVASFDEAAAKAEEIDKDGRCKEGGRLNRILFFWRK